MKKIEADHYRFEIFQKSLQIKNGLDQLIAPVTQKHGISPLSTAIMCYLNCSEDITMNQLYKTFNFNQGNTSSLCKKLEKDGFLIRERKKEDERLVELHLTEKGKKTIESIEKDLEELNKIASSISKEEWETALKGLDSLSKIIQTLNDFK